MSTQPNSVDVATTVIMNQLLQNSVTIISLLTKLLIRAGGVP